MFLLSLIKIYTEKVSPVSPVCPSYFLVNRGQEKSCNFKGVKGYIYIVSPVSPVIQYYMYFKKLFLFACLTRTRGTSWGENKKNISRITFWFPPKNRVHRRQNGINTVYYSGNTVSSSFFSTGDNRRHISGKSSGSCRNGAVNIVFCMYLILRRLMHRVPYKTGKECLPQPLPRPIGRTQ